MVTFRLRSLVMFVAGVAVALVILALFYGWRAQAALDPAESTFVPVAPARVLDTRNPTDIGLAGPFVSPVSQKLQVTGDVPTTTGHAVVVPPGATGVVLNVTAVGATSDGFVSIRPGDAQGAATTSNLNVSAGEIVPNAVTVQLPTAGPNAGKIDISYDAYGQAGPTADILVDVVGYTTNAGLADLQGQVDSLAAQVAVLETKLASVSVETVDGQPTVRFTGVNVQVVDGTGNTDGPTNGRGNLVVGYNEDDVDVRSGSHNLVLGRLNSYSGHSGIVAGFNNTIAEESASVIGGSLNASTKSFAVVTGGNGNTAMETYAAIVGGQGNVAAGNRSTAVGGNSNDATGAYSTVSGGDGNLASGQFASVSGGRQNDAAGAWNSVVGGDQRTCNNVLVAMCGEGGLAAPD